MKKRYAKVTAACLAAAVILSLAAPQGFLVQSSSALSGGREAAEAATVSPAAKEEVIYANLKSDGTAAKLYAVNILELDGSGELTDYGDYTDLKNLTSTDKIIFKNGRVTIDPENAVSENTAAYSDNSHADGRLYYQGTLRNAELPWNISVNYYLDGDKLPAAKLAGKSGALKIKIEIEENPNADRTFFASYALQAALTLDTNFCRNITAEGATIANVGSDKQLTYTILPGKGASIEVTADVNDFEMSEIKINGIRLNMDVDIDDSELTAQAERLISGVAEIDSGAAGLEAGAGNLNEGTAALANGIGTLQDNVSFAAYKSAMMQQGLDIDTLKAGNDQAIQELQAMIGSVTQQISSLQQALKQPGADTATINAQISQLSTQNTRLQEVIILLQGSNANIAGTEVYLTTVNEELGNVKTAAGKLNSGAAELNAGAGKLSLGTSAIKDKTSGIEDKIAEQIDSVTAKITGGDDNPVSFISAKNTNVEAVQFVIKTEAIKMPEAVQPAAEEKKADGIWQKFFDLFS